MKRSMLKLCLCCTAMLGASTARGALINPTLEKAITLFNSTGVLTFTASTNTMNISASGIIIQFDGFEILLPTSTVSMNLRVNGSGNLIGGVSGPDLTLTGTIDYNDDGTPEYQGTLLTAEIRNFGFLEQGTTDLFDFVFKTSGGQLAGVYGKYVGVTLASENSTFNNNFCQDFGGGAKGTIGNQPGDKCPKSSSNWKCDDDWPLNSLTIGGVTYSRWQLINMMNGRLPGGQSAGEDPSVKLIRHLIAAKLNMLIGVPPTDELVAYMAEADALLAQYPPGSNAECQAKTRLLQLKDIFREWSETRPCGCEREHDDKHSDCNNWCGWGWKHDKDDHKGGCKWNSHGGGWDKHHSCHNR